MPAEQCMVSFKLFAAISRNYCLSKNSDTSVITETAKDATRQLEQRHQAIALAGPAIDFFKHGTACNYGTC